jgi:hypothetical protein
MNLGMESKGKVIAVVVLGIVIIGLVVWDVNRIFFGTSPAPASAASASAPAGASPSGNGAAKRIPVSLSKLDPTLHPEIMAQAESLRYTGSGRNIFSMNSAPPAKIEAVKGPVRPVQHIAAGPVGPPPPPPIDLQFFGYEARNGVRKAFLLQGSNVYIASPGDVVAHRYKIVKILPFSIEVTDLMYNHTQSLPLARS